MHEKIIEIDAQKILVKNLKLGKKSYLDEREMNKKKNAWRLSGNWHFNWLSRSLIKIKLSEKER